MSNKDKNHNGLIMAEKHIQYTDLPLYSVQRQILHQEDANEISGYTHPGHTISQTLQTACCNIELKKVVKETIPVIDWLPKYSFKKNFIGDLTAGITVAVMHIPQGMAYGLLAGVTPSVGLYMAFFPCLAYFIFGTSRHISMGTFAVISLMTAKIVATYSGHPLHAATTTDAMLNATINGTAVATDETIYTAMQVVTAVSFIVGVYHFLMCFFRLGMMSSLLSEPLVNGFTTAAAVHVLVSQLKDILGVNIPRHKGAFKIIYTLTDIFNNIHLTNSTTLLVGVAIIIFMVTMNEFVKPWMAKKCRFPIPSELIAVVGGTAFSYFTNIGTHYNVSLVGNIPVGLPMPQFPPIALIWAVAVDSIAIAIVSYSVVMSMGLIFAKKHSYEVRPNQELLALGFSNFVGSCFSCIPISCSLARSLIQEQTGGKTQVASLVSASIIVVVLLWIGPFFETLPRCVLAGIIIVALKGMFMQATQLKRFYKEGLMEALIWIITFFGVIIIDIDFGLLLGVILSLGALYMFGWKSHYCVLGQIGDTGVYVDLKHHRTAAELPKMKIFQYTGSINFASRAGFKKSLYENVDISIRTIRRASLIRGKNEIAELHGMQHVVLDLSCVAHIDSAGCKTLTEIQNDFKMMSVSLYLACPSDRVYDALHHAQDLGEGPFQIFSTVHDAVLYSQSLEHGEKDHVHD